MPMTTESRILSEMHETMAGLHSTGLITKDRLKALGALSQLEVHEMTPQEIRTLRERANVSQSVFAAVLNTSASTVQKWEIGAKKPSGPSLKLLNLIERKGLEAVL